MTRSIGRGVDTARTVVDMIAERTRDRPDRVAVVCGDDALTYADLDARSTACARSLRARGVGPEVLVGLYVDRSVEAIVAIIAIWKAGGAYVPLDPAYPSERLAAILSDASPAVVVTRTRLASALPAGVPTLCLDAPDTDAHVSADFVELPPDRLALVMYTSGSTGVPKGVMVTHANLSHYLPAIQAALKVTADDRYLHTASFAFSSSVRQALLPLSRGASLIVASPEEIRSPLALFEKIRRLGVTVIDIVPSYWRTCIQILIRLDAAERTRLLDNDLRLILSASEPLSAETPRRWARDLGHPARVINMYGQTETAGIVTVYEMPAIEEHASGSVPVGRPIGDNAVYVLDAEGRPAPIGERGQIHVAGPAIARGYYNRPELTAERFIPNRFAAGGGLLYKTGDIGRLLADGTIELVGRADSQVKVRGFRVEPIEIEAALRLHPSVAEAAVVVQDEIEGGARLVALVVLAPGQSPSPAHLLQYLRGKLPEHSVPSRIDRLESMPMTATGKVDRRALLSLVGRDAAAGGGRRAPTTPTERRLAAIWRELLAAGDVGADDSFFDIGGQSLLAAQMLSRIRDAFGVEVPWRQLFEAPTVAALARLIEAGDTATKAPVDGPLAAGELGEAPQPSLGQQRLWFLEQLTPATAAYNVVRAVDLDGPLDVDALERSLNEIVERHAILRASFPAKDGEPSLVISPVVRLALRPEAIDAEELPTAIAAEADRPFATADGPLVRCRLLRSAPGRHTLIVVVHHIVTDGWSMEILFGELGRLYAAFAAGRPSPLPALPLQYADFARWQRRYVEGPAHRAHLDYWRERLGNGSAVLDLPTDRPRPPVQTYRGAVCSATLPRDLCDRLEALSRREGVTLFMTLLAGFQTLLYRYTGQTDITVGTPIAGRPRADVERLIGMFINMLVLRTDLTGGPQFRQLLDRVRQTALDAYEHQDVPFEKLVEVLHPVRDLSRSPLFEVLFSFQNVPRQALDLAGVVVSDRPAHTRSAKFDLSLYLVPDPSSRGLRANLEYNTDLFDAATAARMLGHFQTMMEAAAADPTRSIADLPLLTPVEWRRLVIEWNQTSRPLPADALVHHLFEAQAARTPHAVAVTFADSRCTYAELDRRANRLARRLRSLGVGPDVLVGVCVERSIEMLVGLLAILKAGGAYVPLDPTYPRDRLEFIARDAQLSLLLTQSPLRELLTEVAPIVCIDSAEQELAAGDDSPLDNPPSPDALAYVIYTSGSTGRPKGVEIPHRAVVNFLLALQRQHRLGEGDALLAVTTLSFDIAGLELYLPLVSGARVVLASREVAMDGARLIEALERSGASIMQATPTTWQLLVEAGWRGDRRLTVLCGGEGLPRELAGQLLARCGELWNMYGPTETTIWSTSHRVTGDAPISIGRPIDNTQVYVLDRERHPVPIGVGGELFIGGSGLARGYRHRPDLTSQKFVTNPFAADRGARLYATGDLARYRADGTIELIGRIDHQVKVRGFRIELGEIESVLTRCPGVAQAVAVVREDAPGARTLAAYVTVERGSEVSVEQLVELARAQLPDYMVPSSIVRLEALPLTPNGKIDRGALPAPERTRALARESFAAPRDHLERQIADIWQRVLGVRDVGVRDNFFALGGYSLLAVRVVAQIEKVLGRKIPVTALFQKPTVEQLAELLREQASFVPWSALAPLQTRGSRPPFFWVHGEASDAILPRHLGPDQPLYGLLHQAHDGHRARYTTVEDIAAHYLSEIRSVQPRGPYFVGGFCFGGVVAFEIAQQLKAAGEPVALLALVDPSELRHVPVSQVRSGIADAGASLVDKLARQWKETDSPDGGRGLRLLERLARKSRDRALTVWSSVRKRSQALASRMYLALGLVLPDRLRSQYILDVYFSALDGYRPAVYTGHVVLFRGKRTWAPILLGRVDVHEVSGSHTDILQEAQVNAWAPILKPYLLQAQAATRHQPAT